VSRSDVGGVALYWREWGEYEAPPLIVLHPGPGTDGGMFGEWLAPLGDRYRVLALDLPDHGLSGDSRPGERSFSGYAAAVSAFAEALGLEDYTLLGHSFGSFVALTHAVEQPGAAARVIVSCGAADHRFFDGFEERVEALGRPDVVAAFQAEEDAETEDDLRAAWAGQMPFFCADPDGAACRELVAQLAQVHFRVDVALDPDAFDSYDVLGALDRVEVPVLAIAGRQDRATSPTDAGVIATRVRDGRLAVLDDAGHFAYAEQPGAYLAAVRDFLR
jgi:pimeloyl-ACP methyl ester carboxylesterase